MKSLLASLGPILLSVKIKSPKDFHSPTTHQAAAHQPVHGNQIFFFNAIVMYQFPNIIRLWDYEPRKNKTCPSKHEESIIPSSFIECAPSFANRRCTHQHTYASTASIDL
eukprot:TRINITY_DN232_c0_g1_i13.p1 TRINITY_DN232_c0_g1~~TRINITY_DN232_c0_g1_i13.p1  ORF type:complete len:110 (+),score=11.58 TRINITY_DN232_c0_g1_i13:501-830(+)